MLFPIIFRQQADSALFLEIVMNTSVVSARKKRVFP